MENLTDVFSKFFDKLNSSRKKTTFNKDELLFTKLFNDKLLDDLQKNIQNYAINHIKNFDSDQDYYQLKKIHGKTKLFVDYKFAAQDSSVCYSNEYKNWLKSQKRLNSNGNIIWKRAKEIRVDAKMIANKKSYKLNEKSTNEEVRNCLNTADLNQGLVGDCWFVAAATGIIENIDLFRKIVPLDNSFSDEEYCGLFHFRFWRFGTWYDVCIDDYLPVGPDGDLNFCHNKLYKSEFWCALLEKAYAKVNGSYEALEGGFTSDALVDMSGGVEEKFSLRDISYSNFEIENLWSILLQARTKKSVICCNLEPDEEITDLMLPTGLVKGHAYVVTTLVRIKKENNKIYRLLKCHNPWGNNIEFKGDWSKSSTTWNILRSDTKKSLLDKVKKPGQFWMGFYDWINHFDSCQLFNLAPDSILDNNFKDKEYLNKRLFCSLYSSWHCYNFESNWICGLNAGGRGETEKPKFWINPQFLVIITKYDIVSNDGHATLIISLMQQIDQTNHSLDEYIQFRIYQIINKKALLECFRSGEQIDAKNLKYVGSSGQYINRREVVKRFNLTPGEYVIIPSTYDNDIELKFLLRVFSEKPLYNAGNEIKRNTELENLKSFFTYVNELLVKHGFPSNMKPNELESKSSSNLKIINDLLPAKH